MEGVWGGDTVLPSPALALLAFLPCQDPTSAVPALVFALLTAGLEMFPLV